MKADSTTQDNPAPKRFLGPGMRATTPTAQMLPTGGAGEVRIEKTRKKSAALQEAENKRLDTIGNCAFSDECAMVHTASQSVILSFSGFEEKPFFHNIGNGKFVELGAVMGLGVPYDGRGLEAADFEGCGAVDLVLKNAYKPALLYFRNEVGADKNMLTLRLRSPKTKNRFAVGARVLLEVGDRKQAQEVECGGSFLSCGPQELYFGLAEAKAATRITIAWPSGNKTVLADVPSGIVTVNEGEDGFRHEPYRKRKSKVEAPAVHPLRRGDSTDTLKLSTLSLGFGELPSFKDRWTVVDAWSSRCSSCVGELPNYKELALAAEKHGAGFVAVNVDDDPKRAFETAKRLDSSVAVFRAVDPSALVNPYEPLVPATLVIGPDGKVRARHTGVLSPAELEAFLLDAKR